MARDFDKEISQLGTNTRAQLTSMFKKTSALSTDVLNLLYLNARDNVVAKYAQTLKDIQRVDPQKASKIIKQASIFFEGNIMTINDVIDAIYDYLEYYHAIKTEEELKYEFERANKYVQYPNIDLPIILEFDYQFYTVDDIFQKPTFYSYANMQYRTEEFGRGAYFIAFPSTQKHLTDDEVMVAMKHEFGHIFQNHCTTNFSGNAKFDSAYANSAMDISINVGMTEEEQELLMQLAHKIWKNKNSFPCINLRKPDGKGGFGINMSVNVGDWRGTLNIIKSYYRSKKQDEGGGGTGGTGGTGGGGGGGGQTQPQPNDDKIKVGDYVLIKDSDPKTYGKVNAVNDMTGEISVTEISKEEWENIKNS